MTEMSRLVRIAKHIMRHLKKDRDYSGRNMNIKPKRRMLIQIVKYIRHLKMDGGCNGQNVMNIKTKVVILV